MPARSSLIAALLQGMSLCAALTLGLTCLGAPTDATTGGGLSRADLLWLQRLTYGVDSATIERFRRLGKELSLQLVVAETGGVLVGNLLVEKRLVGNGKGKLARLGLRVHNAIRVVPSARFQLKPKVLNLCAQMSFLG